jgi:RNA polymerase sigma-70 factor (ECF subfamily)
MTDRAERDSGPAADSPGPTAAGETTSSSLLDRARAQDADAWQRIVALYRPLVLGWCARAGLRGADAEDVAQEVFAAAVAGLGRFRRDRAGDTFRGWLRGVTRNHVLLYFRRRYRQPQGEGGSDAWERLQAVAGPGPEEEAEVGQLYRRAVEQVRGEFEPRTWQAFWLTVIEQRSTAAVADELGMTPANVRQARSRVLRRLKHEMGELLD